VGGVEEIVKPPALSEKFRVGHDVEVLAFP